MFHASMGSRVVMKRTKSGDELRTVYVKWNIVLRRGLMPVVLLLWNEIRLSWSGARRHGHLTQHDIDWLSKLLKCRFQGYLGTPGHPWTSCHVDWSHAALGSTHILGCA